MLHRYETLLLTVPEITQDEAAQIEKEVSKRVDAAKGKLVSFERWGKYKLAYPVKKNDYGVYFLARFEIPNGTTLLDDLKTYFAVKLHTVVMRNMFHALDMDAPLAYQRPKSLEEAPASSHDVDTFLKENKMEGLLASSKKEEKAAAKPAEKPAVEATEKKEETPATEEAPASEDTTA